VECVSVSGGLRLCTKLFVPLNPAYTLDLEKGILGIAEDALKFGLEACVEGEAGCKKNLAKNLPYEGSPGCQNSSPSRKLIGITLILMGYSVCCAGGSMGP